MTKKEQKQEEAKKELLQLIEEGDTLIISIKSVSASGMSRRMSVHLSKKNDSRLLYLTYNVADLLGYKLLEDETIRVSGCGMDMAFWLANAITYRLYKDEKPEWLTGNGGGCLEWQTI